MSCMVSRQEGEWVFRRLRMLEANILTISEVSEMPSTTDVRDLGKRFNFLTADQKPVFFSEKTLRAFPGQDDVAYVSTDEQRTYTFQPASSHNQHLAYGPGSYPSSPLKDGKRMTGWENCA